MPETLPISGPGGFGYLHVDVCINCGVGTATPNLSIVRHVEVFRWFPSPHCCVEFAEKERQGGSLGNL